tara:strand:- start:33 stop:407 length:375 start_codon:yes stop_codon:yes gene_type:complete
MLTSSKQEVFFSNLIKNNTCMYINWIYKEIKQINKEVKQMLTRKHFEAIVKILAQNKYKEHTDILNDFCNFFKSENSNFSNERFLDKYNKLTSQIDVERIETMFKRPEVAYKNAVNTLKRSIKR